MTNEERLAAAAAAKLSECRRYPRSGDGRVDWQATEAYWADPREQQVDRCGRTPRERGERVYLP